jgi:hypothetical protein
MTDRIENITAVRKNPAVQETPTFPPAAKTGASATDTAKLSLTAQARLLKERGATVDEIASQLGLTVAVVLGDLGLPNTTTPGQLTTK